MIRPANVLSHQPPPSGTEPNETAPVPGLAQLLRSRTSELHAQAEASGILASILAGTVSRASYAVYLRNLLPAYQAMEQALQTHRAKPGFAFFSQRSLHRSERIEADLNSLAGSDWAAALPLLPAGERYAERVAAAGAGGGDLLIAHAYTRYLGDLNGGQALRRRLVRLFGPETGAAAFTEFPEITPIGDFIAAFRAALDEVGRYVTDSAQVVEEAAVAFTLNIALSDAVAAVPDEVHSR